MVAPQAEARARVRGRSGVPRRHPAASARPRRAQLHERSAAGAAREGVPLRPDAPGVPGPGRAAAAGVLDGVAAPLVGARARGPVSRPAALRAAAGDGHRVSEPAGVRSRRGRALRRRAHAQGGPGPHGALARRSRRDLAARHLDAGPSGSGVPSEQRARGAAAVRRSAAGRPRRHRALRARHVGGPPRLQAGLGPRPGAVAARRLGRRPRRVGPAGERRPRRVGEPLHHGARPSRQDRAPRISLSLGPPGRAGRADRARDPDLARSRARRARPGRGLPARPALPGRHAAPPDLPRPGVLARSRAPGAALPRGRVHHPEDAQPRHLPAAAASRAAGSGRRHRRARPRGVLAQGRRRGVPLRGRAARLVRPRLDLERHRDLHRLHRRHRPRHPGRRRSRLPEREAPPRRARR